MTEYFFELIPSYGSFVIFVVVLLACLAVPLPSSALVLASGGFAAAGDLSLASVFVVAFTAFVLGDQIAFGLARFFGPKLTSRLKRRPRFAKVLEKGERMVEQRGVIAVLLSHTILSPTCPYVSYVSGAGGMKWLPFTTTAILGSGIWTASYVALGYSFASQLTQITDILGQVFILAGALFALIVFWKILRRRWEAHVH